LIAYADTGFLISLYGRDANSASAISLLTPRPVLLLTSFGEVEFSNAVELIAFRKEWTSSQARAIHETFRQHQGTGVFRMVPIVPEIWEKALALSRRFSGTLGTRTLDILHVATALVLTPDVFFSFDERQRKLARAERLRLLPV
jgi:predicted nucleic acid-binding protein